MNTGSWSFKSRGSPEEDDSITLPSAPQDFSTFIPSLGFGGFSGGFSLGCGSGGTLFEMPGCSHCNRLTRYPADTLYARIQAGFSATLLGSGGFRKVETL